MTTTTRRPRRATKKASRRKDRERPTRNVADQIIARYGVYAAKGRHGKATLAIGEPPSSDDIRGMGPLVEIRVRRHIDGHVETWLFTTKRSRTPMPRLAYHRKSKRLWVVGGAFRIDGKGFHRLSGVRGGLKRVSVKDAAKKYPGQARVFQHDRYGIAPTEAVRATLTVPAKVISVGFMESIAYKADRNDGDGRSEWEHPIEDEGEEFRETKFHRPPHVCVNVTGTKLYILGGSYTIKEGWIVG